MRWWLFRFTFSYVSALLYLLLYHEIRFPFILFIGVWYYNPFVCKYWILRIWLHSFTWFRFLVKIVSFSKQCFFNFTELSFLLIYHCYQCIYFCCLIKLTGRGHLDCGLYSYICLSSFKLRVIGFELVWFLELVSFYRGKSDYWVGHAFESSIFYSSSLRLLQFRRSSIVPRPECVQGPLWWGVVNYPLINT